MGLTEVHFNIHELFALGIRSLIVGRVSKYNEKKSISKDKSSCLIEIRTWKFQIPIYLLLSRYVCE